MHDIVMKIVDNNKYRFYWKGLNDPSRRWIRFVSKDDVTGEITFSYMFSKTRDESCKISSASVSNTTAYNYSANRNFIKDFNCNLPRYNENRFELRYKSSTVINEELLITYVAETPEHYQLLFSTELPPKHTNGSEDVMSVTTLTSFNGFHVTNIDVAKEIKDFLEERKLYIARY